MRLRSLGGWRRGDRLLLLAVVAGVGVSGVLGWSWWGHASLEASRASTITVASSAATTLSTVGADGVDLETLTDLATPEYADELADQAEAYESAVESAQIMSSSAVVSAGVVSLHRDRADVLVAVTATVTSPTSGQQDRYYTMLVELVRADSGWLVDSLEFAA